MDLSLFLSLTVGLVCVAPPLGYALSRLVANREDRKVGLTPREVEARLAEMTELAENLGKLCQERQSFLDSTDGAAQARAWAQEVTRLQAEAAQLTEVVQEMTGRKEDMAKECESLEAKIKKARKKEKEEKYELISRVLVPARGDSAVYLLGLASGVDWTKYVRVDVYLSDVPVGQVVSTKGLCSLPGWAPVGGKPGWLELKGLLR